MGNIRAEGSLQERKEINELSPEDYGKKCSPDVLKSESVTNLMSSHESEMGAATPESLDLDPVLLLVKVDISSVKGLKCVSQNSALPIKGLSVPVRAVINEIQSVAKHCPY